MQFGELPGDASVTFHQYWLLSADHSHYRRAAKMLGAVDAALEGELLRLSLGDYAFLGPEGLG